MICRHCKEEKQLELFPRDINKKSGHKTICKACVSLTRKSRAGDTAVRVYNRVYQQLHSKELSSRYFTRDYRVAQLARYHNNREIIRVKQSEYLKTPSGRVKNAAKEGRRRSQKLNATPKWLTPEQLTQIEYLYWLSRDLEIVSGQKYHVDHEVPLRGKKVCGLHVPWNLRVIPAEINLSKGNRYEQDY